MKIAKAEDILFPAIAFEAAVMPFFRGGWDIWAQTLGQSILLISAAAYLIYATAKTGFPQLANRYSAAPMAWAILAWISLVSCRIQPMALEGFKFAAATAAMAVLAARISIHQKDIVKTLLVISGVMVTAIALAQFLLKHRMAGVSGAFFNPNVFAGFILMTIPLAFEKKWKWAAAVMLGGLLLSGSRGAWIAAAITGLLYAIRNKNAFAKITVLLACAAAGTAIFFFSDSLSVTQRAAWWGSAWDLAKLHPFTGFGPGTFQYIYPFTHRMVTGALSTLYAHNFPLQMAAESGFIFAIICTGWLIWRVIPLKTASQFALLAILIHSLQDFSLNIYSNAMLAMFLSADTENKPVEHIRFSGMKKIMLTGMLAAAALGIMLKLPSEWLEQRSLLTAKTNFEQNQTAENLAALAATAETMPDNPNAALVYAQALEPLSPQTAVVQYEKALRINPFRPSTYDDLFALYEKLRTPQLQSDIYSRREDAKPY